MLTILSLALATAVSASPFKLPPMGWLSWERFRCNVDCTNDPENCISEKLYMDMADRLVEDGWVDFGFNRCNIDDCWAAKQRDKNGNLVADPIRFPHGIAWLAEYMHNRSLKLGLYGDYGTETCGGYPGTYGHTKQDAETIASWGVDSWKMDGCYNPNKTAMPVAYQEFAATLDATGRDILLSCSWPAYFQGNMPINYTLLNTGVPATPGSSCAGARIYDDIQDDWSSVSGIIQFWGDHWPELRASQKPGYVHDPDMIIVGDTALATQAQMRTQMSLWSIWSAPLYMSNDLRNISKMAMETIQNKEVLEVNQDPMVDMGMCVRRSVGEAWCKNLANGDIAVALYNSNTKSSEMVTLPLDICGIKGSVAVRDLWAHQDLGTISGVIEANVSPMGTEMYRLTPQ